MTTNCNDCGEKLGLDGSHVCQRNRPPKGWPAKVAKAVELREYPKDHDGTLLSPCQGKNCGTLNGWLHSAECFAEHEAARNLPGQYKAVPSALDVQVAGTHYKDLKIQPIEYNHANAIPFAEGNVIKYVTRWRTKGGIKDLEKAKHFIELLIELETRQ